MSNDLKYSVLMSLYKNELPEHFRVAFESMVKQSVPPEQIVIVEDGPLPEELISLIEGFSADYPKVVTVVVNEKNIGLGLALNKGLGFCRNELVARMDTDDISLPGRCERQLDEFAKNSDLALVGSNVDEFIGSPDNIVSTRRVPSDYADIYEFAKRRSAFNHPAVMYKKSSVLSVGGYSDLRRNQDVDLFGRMLYSGLKAMNIDESLLLFRSGDSLAKRRRSWANTSSYIEVIKKFWKMGYSSFVDFALVAAAQSFMFLCPNCVQHLLYKTFLR
ncbi:glycosyltransferase [Collinsella aerofaciens]|uniref:glycosyltransferase n=1 Tax=Collinsella aerofaciens TaxID=74426 RepID=UPI003567A1CE